MIFFHGENLKNSVPSLKTSEITGKNNGNIGLTMGNRGKMSKIQGRGRSDK